MLLLLLLIPCVAGDYDANLRSSLTSDHVTGYMMISLLLRKSQPDILTDVQKAMGDKAYPENRLRDLLGEAISFSVVPQEVETRLIWREERLKVAKQLLNIYENDKSVLDRVVAIDELTVLNGKLELIAASSRSKFVHFDFVRTGKTKKEDMMHFLRELHKVLEVKNPIVLWDNINIHKNRDVAHFFLESRWNAWPHPVESSDMNPLDYHDFKQLKRWWNVKSDMTVDQAELSVRTAINKMNNELLVQGIITLPNVWRALIRTEGLMTV